MSPQGNLATPAAAARASLPVVLAYLPLGAAAGIVGARMGLSPMEVTLLSVLVFAGSAQFIFAELVGGSALALVVTIFLVNFRHLLYSTALAQRIKHLSTGRRVAIGAQLTDESFALMSILYRGEARARGLLVLNMCGYLAWLCGNIGGALLGEVVDVEQWGADYLLIAMFAALLMLNFVSAPRKMAAFLALAVAGGLSIGLGLAYPHPLNILLAAAVAAAVAAFAFRNSSDDSSSNESENNTNEKAGQAP